MKTPRLTVLEKIGFGSGDAAVNIVWSSLAIIITFFYTDVYKLNVAHIAMLGLLPRLIDAFADVIMGMYTDSHTTRWGRYRPYFFIFAVPFGLAVMLVFTTPELSYMRQADLGLRDVHPDDARVHGITIPYISLPGVLTADPQQRLSANGYRLFFAKGASLLVTTFVPIFAARWGQEHIAQGYQVSMAIMAVLATLLFFFCFFTTTERVAQKRAETTGSAARLALQQRPMADSGRSLRDRHHRLCRSAGPWRIYYAKYYLAAATALRRSSSTSATNVSPQRDAKFWRPSLPSASSATSSRW